MARVETRTAGKPRCLECGTENFAEPVKVVDGDVERIFCGFGCAGDWSRSEYDGDEHVEYATADKVTVKVTCDYCKVTIGNYLAPDAPVKSVRVSDRTGREITDEEFCGRNCLVQKYWNK